MIHHSMQLAQSHRRLETNYQLVDILVGEVKKTCAVSVDIVPLDENGNFRHDIAVVGNVVPLEA